MKKTKLVVLLIVLMSITGCALVTKENIEEANLEYVGIGHFIVPMQEDRLPTGINDPDFYFNSRFTHHDSRDKFKVHEVNKDYVDVLDQSVSTEVNPSAINTTYRTVFYQQDFNSDYDEYISYKRIAYRVYYNREKDDYELRRVEGPIVATSSYGITVETLVYDTFTEKIENRIDEVWFKRAFKFVSLAITDFDDNKKIVNQVKNAEDIYEYKIKGDFVQVDLIQYDAQEGKNIHTTELYRREDLINNSVQFKYYKDDGKLFSKNIKLQISANL